jgi:2-keto-4-pentenoate hydratase/2-oxohepta-3-ene-1,7-dioic acid hydratase in catechol pathway
MNLLFDKLIKTPQNKIICLAKNYLKHALEMGEKNVPSYPVAFSKPWSSIIYEPNPVRIKMNEGHRIDHEGK